MRFSTLASAASLAAGASAAANERTFAVLRFNGDGFMTEGRLDPIVNPGTLSTHHHGIMGGSGFGKTVNGEDLLKSKCTSAKIANDKSNYWVPSLWFQSPTNGTLYKVPLFYMNVYYFCGFPPGLKMVIGDAATRDAPKFGGGTNLINNGKPIQPIQFTCPRSDNNAPLYPTNSDGSKAGMQDPNNKGVGAGFPMVECDGYASPLRQDIHFPSCYNPKAGLNDYKNNMAWPTQEGWKQNCPEGWTHVPHIFFEVYWNTPLFVNEWSHDGTSQPFVFSNGDATGYSSHGDFLAGWDVNTLQTIIDTCNAGDIGMDKCPNIPGGLNTDNDCHITVEDSIANTRVMKQGLSVLPGGNKITGWGKGGVTGGSVSSPASGGDSSDDSEAPAASSNTGAAAPSPSPAANKPFKQAVAQPEKVAPAPQPTQPAVVDNKSPAEGTDANGMKTVWDVVTVTDYTTVAAEPTGAAKRDEHVHDHMARHINRRNRRSE
ncbi:NOL1/NOP2/sun family protein [Apiospora kogelbergensis]|uniref:NOL1/NOP2/sun family protein n=1 Tax=Apiospora kogelbergensis TaxID=1337665 RepID=A0AAW0R2Y3_9PEZI